jgi:outer membrane protein TolC
MIRPQAISLKLIVLLAVTASAWAQDTNAPLRLTLEDAIHRGLQCNLGILVAESRRQEAAGTTERRRSLLLPRVHIETPVAVQSRSLKAQGISVPGLPLPDVVGPFSTYDARAYVDQPIVDLQALHTLRSAKQSAAAAKSDYQDARDQVIRTVAALYLSAQSQFAEVVASQSRVETAQALYKLAVDQRDAGIATGIDVLRAQVELANERQSLVQSRNRAKGSLLVLARNIGLSPGTTIELADPLAFHEARSMNADTVLPLVLAARADYQSLLRQRDALNEQLRASHARFLPKLNASGNYGGIGRSIGGMQPTGVAQLSLSLTVFDRDRDGEAQEIEARIRRIEQQLNDTKLGVEQELRQALLDLESAAEEVTVAGAGLELAQKEVDLARLRFSQGVTNNIEVITAQDALSRAQQNSIVALTHHTDARISMVRALGNTEASYTEYLGSR